MRLGVCYYPEQWPEDRWQTDVQLMRNLGLKIVRVGEFSWYKLEPSKRKYEWDWLDRLVQTISNEGLEIVLATPTARPPVWLVNNYPDIVINGSNLCDSASSFKTNVCVNHPVVMEYAYSIVSEMGKRYGGNSNIIGWQIDNKFRLHSHKRCYCEHCAKNFRLWLEQKYSSLEALNQTWGTIYLNGEYTEWGQIVPPNPLFSNPNPPYALDYQRFCSDSIAAFQKMQIDTLAAFTTNQFVTHNCSFTNYELDYFKLGSDLDFMSWNSYPTVDAEKMAEIFYESKDQIPDFVYDVGDPYISGFLHNCVRGFKNAPFWVMEQQCGRINWGHSNPGIRIGAVRLWTWHAISCGAESIIYSRWRAPRYSNGQMEAGLLRYDGSPDNGYHDIANMHPEAPVLVQLDEAPITSKVAILARYDDLWAIKDQSLTKEFSYLRLLFSYYRVLTSMGVSVDITTYEADLSDYRLLIVPVLYLSDTALVSKLESFVAQGGSLLFGPRSGFKDDANVVIEGTLPGLLINLVGAKIQHGQALPESVRFSIRSDISGLSGNAGVWIEAIQPEEDEGVTILARYLGGPIAGKPAMTVHPFGAGNVYYLGFYPTFEQLKAITKYLVQLEGTGNLLDLPDGVIVNQRGNNRVAFNFTRNEKSFVLDDKLVTIPPRDFRYNLRD